MKTLILTIALSLTALTATAAPKSNSLEALKELCALDAGQKSETAYEDTFLQLAKLDIKKISTLSATKLAMVNTHLVNEEYIQSPMTFAEIKALFSPEAEYGYDDLYIITLKSKATGRIYTYVRSYPGDNPYGLIFDSKTHKAVAHNGDDSIVLLTDNGSYSCWELDK